MYTLNNSLQENTIKKVKLMDLKTDVLFANAKYKN